MIASAASFSRCTNSRHFLQRAPTAVSRKRTLASAIRPIRCISALLVPDTLLADHHFDQNQNSVSGSSFITVPNQLQIRSFSQHRTSANIAAMNRTKHQKHQRGSYSNNNKYSSKQKEKDIQAETMARDTTLRILQLGSQAKENAANGNSMDIVDIQQTVEEPTFWSQADKALQWWTLQKNHESVQVSFQLLDALADLSSIAQDPQLSSPMLNTKMLNKAVQNWLHTFQKQQKQQQQQQWTTPDDIAILSPDDLFQKLEQYRDNSRTTSRTRRKLKPDLTTFHMVMEGAASRATSKTNQQQQQGFNESVLRHLMKQIDDPSLQPTLKTIAHIVHGWSSRGQVVSKEELETIVTLMKDLKHTDASSKQKSNKHHDAADDKNNDNDRPVDLFNTALVALADTNSNAKDACTAEKTLLILNFMRTVAMAYPEMATDIHPNIDTYHVVLNAFSRAGKGAQAELVLQDMIARYEETTSRQSENNNNDNQESLPLVEPDAKSFTIAMTAYGNSEENHAAEKAEGVLKWQQHLNEEDGPLQGSLSPETITYNNVLRAWAFRRSQQAVERCEELRKEMYKQKISPNQQTYGQSLKCIALSNLKEKGRQAVKVWREMEFHRIEPDDFTRKYFEKCVAVRSKKSNRRGRSRGDNGPIEPIRAPRPFD